MNRKYINKKYLFKIPFELLNIIRELKKNHPCLFWTCLISLIFGVLPFAYCLISFEWKFKLLGLIFLIPLIITFLITGAAVRLFEYVPNLSRILSFILNTFVILFIQICIGLLFFYILMFADLDAKCNQIKHYKLALSNVDLSNTSHFPHKIPNEAKNAELKASTYSFFGSEDLYLKFDTNKEYIDKELKKYNFIKICNHDKCSDGSDNNYRYYSGDIDIKDFTFYVINDKEHENLPEHSFPYHYGIGVNYNTNQILYYYENPD